MNTDYCASDRFPIYRDSLLRIPLDFFPVESCEIFRVPNKNFGKYASEPEYFDLSHVLIHPERGPEITVPRNFPIYRYLHNYKVVDDTVDGKHVVFPDMLWPLRDYQAAAKSDVFKYWGDQILVASCGSGKTVMGVAIASEYGRKAAVLVSTDQLNAQWCERIEESLGIKAGSYSGTVKTDGDIVVFSVQSLYDRELPREYADEFGLLIFDECHEAGALEWNKALRNFRAKVRIGLSATPYRDDGLDDLMFWSLGDIIHTVDRKELIAQGDVLVPDILVIPVDYPETLAFKKQKRIPKKKSEPIIARIQDELVASVNVSMFGTETAPEVAEPELPPEIDLVKTASNLAVHDGRNRIIAINIQRCVAAGRKILVVVDRTVSFEKIGEILKEFEIPYAVLNGKTKREQLSEIYRSRVILAMFGCVKRGLDVPDLDTAILACPKSNRAIIEQLVGRPSRPFPGKKKPLIIDIYDKASLVFTFMLNARKKVYRRLGCHFRNVA